MAYSIAFRIKPILSRRHMLCKVRIRCEYDAKSYLIGFAILFYPCILTRNKDLLLRSDQQSTPHFPIPAPPTLHSKDTSFPNHESAHGLARRAPPTVNHSQLNLVSKTRRPSSTLLIRRGRAAKLVPDERSGDDDSHHSAISSIGTCLRDTIPWLAISSQTSSMLSRMRLRRNTSARRAGKVLHLAMADIHTTKAQAMGRRWRWRC